MTDQQIAARQYIHDYLRREQACDVLDAAFVDGFVRATSAHVRSTCWGAVVCPYLRRTLAAMVKEGTLERSVVTLGGGWQPGFPKWVYSYSLAPTED